MIILFRYFRIIPDRVNFDIEGRQGSRLFHETKGNDGNEMRDVGCGVKHEACDEETSIM